MRGRIVARVVGSTGIVHVVRRAKNGTLYCDCFGWLKQRGIAPERRTCKHVRGLRQLPLFP